MSTIKLPGIYDTPLEKIHSISKYFEKQKDGSLVFIGDTLEARVPIRYKQYGFLDVTQNVETLGLMDLIIDGKYQATLNILAKVTLCPSETEERTLDDTPYLTMKFNTGDTFILYQDVIQDSGVIYCLYVEYITRGHRLYTIGYDDIAKIFDRAKELTGKSVDRIIFEFMVSHLGRNPKNLFEQWRYTDRKLDPVIIFLRSINLSPTSTSTRMMGAYDEDGLTSSLNTEVTKQQPFEDILRGIPTES